MKLWCNLNSDLCKTCTLSIFWLYSIFLIAVLYYWTSQRVVSLKQRSWWWDHLFVRWFYHKVGSLPFTHLGLPFGTKSPSVEDCLPHVRRVERRPSNTSIFLNQGGKPQMVNSVNKQIDRYRRYCLWRGSELNAKKPPLAAWKMVTRTKKQGDWELLGWEHIMMHY